MPLDDKITFLLLFWSLASLHWAETVQASRHTHTMELYRVHSVHWRAYRVDDVSLAWSDHSVVPGSVRVAGLFSAVAVCSGRSHDCATAVRWWFNYLFIYLLIYLCCQCCLNIFFSLVTFWPVFYSAFSHSFNSVHHHWLSQFSAINNNSVHLTWSCSFVVLVLLVVLIVMIAAIKMYYYYFIMCLVPVCLQNYCPPHLGPPSLTH